MEITKATLTQLNKDLAKAVENVLKENGLIIGKQHISFNATSKEGKFTLTIKDNTADPAQVYMQHYYKACLSKAALLKSANISSSSYGALSPKGKYRLTDLNSRSPKYLICAEEVETGKVYRMSVNAWLNS